jgi:glucose/arabinose dehydrogenase
MAAVVPPAGATGPTYFLDESVAIGIDAPSNSQFLPDGRLFVVGQYTAQVSLVVDGSPATVHVVGTIPGVRSGGEAGLIGVTVDPGFPARPYLYVHATHSSPNEIRVTRYTLTGDLAFAGNGAMTLDPASARVVLGALPDLVGKHNGGTMRFGPDGMLYVGLGDDDYPCRAQDLTKLQGKILRLDVSGMPAGGGPAPSYSALTPADNPFVAHADSAARLVWAYGLRNPFSFTIDPPTGCLVIGDVGNDGWEEIEVACVGGRNFGWPHYEGPVRTTLTCVGADTTAFVSADYQYEHIGLGYAVFAGPVYRAPVGATDPFPLDNEGMLFMGDTWKGWVRRLAPSGPGWALAPPEYGQPNPTDWADSPRYITSMHVGPKDGSLWYTMLYRTVPSSGPGEVRRFRYIGPTTDVGDAAGSDADGLAFTSAYPSPARVDRAIELAWRQATPAPVSLRLHDVRGRFVRALASPADGVRAAGPHRVAWDGLSAEGTRVAPGIYLATLEAQGVRRTRRLVRL